MSGRVKLEHRIPELPEQPRLLRPGEIEMSGTGFTIGQVMAQLLYPWPDLWEIEAVEPCPCFEIEWRHIGGRSRRRFVPASRRQEGAVEAEVLALFAHVREHRPHTVKGGWVDVPPATWERVREMPGQAEPAEMGTGFYRSAKLSGEEPVVARWGPPTSMEAMLHWLASTPERPWREHPRSVALTATYVYVERRDGDVVRLPLDVLRVRRGEGRNDVVYVLGRNTPLIVPWRDECPVRAALDARLGLDG